MAQYKPKFSKFDFFNDDADPEDEEEQLFKPKRKATLFLIDARKGMFAENKEKVLNALQAVKQHMRNKIFASQSAVVGVVLLGTKVKNNNLNLNNIYIVQELEHLSADHILKLQDLIKVVEDSLFEDQYGFGDLSLADAFWLAAKLFTDKAYNSDKCIFLFTDDDDPLASKPQEKRRTIMSASDMAQNSITLDLIHLGKKFDVNKFYLEVVQVAMNDPYYVLPDPVCEMSEMLNRVSSVHHHHVSLVKLPFIISEEFKCGVSVHALVRKAKMPFKTKLSKATNEPVQTKLQLFGASTGEEVEKRHLRKVFTIGTEEPSFKLEELKQVSELQERCVRLMGFKPRSAVQLDNFVKPCSFLYPDEAQYKGSTVFFVALLKRCVAKQVVAICTIHERPQSSVRFVALVPQEEVLGEDKAQLYPPGFVVYHLPYAEEVRDVDSKCVGRKRANEAQVELMQKIVKKFKFQQSHKPACFKNPKLETQWLGIEALALRLDTPETTSDDTVPDYEGMTARLGDLTQEFNDEFYSESATSAEQFKEPKPKKKSTIQVNQREVEEEVMSGRGQGLTNDVLKGYLQLIGKGKGLSKVKKSDMLEIISNHLGV